MARLVLQLSSALHRRLLALAAYDYLTPEDEVLKLIRAEPERRWGRWADEPAPEEAAAREVANVSAR
jgi:hypothetical protein